MPIFNPTAFLLSYPQFSTYTNQQLTDIFNNEAIIIGSKIIACFSDTNKQFYYAKLVLAHILTIYSLGLTGRAVHVNEGSVQGQFENIDTSDSIYWSKTVYGQQCYKILQNRGGATLFIGPTPNQYGFF